MVQLTADSPRNFDDRADDFLQRQSIGLTNQDAFVGSAMSLIAASEFANQLVAGEAFLGFLERTVLNASGAAGDKKCNLRTRGIVRGVSITNLVAGTDVGTKIYMSDGDTFTLVSAANTYIGKLVRNNAGSDGDVYFEAGALAIGDS